MFPSPWSVPLMDSLLLANSKSGCKWVEWVGAGAAKLARGKLGVVKTYSNAVSSVTSSCGQGELPSVWCVQ